MESMNGKLQKLDERLNILAGEIKDMKPEDIYDGLLDNIDEISHLQKNFHNLAEFIEKHFICDPASLN